MNPVPPRPTAPVCPDAAACCDSGCDPCIFDFYREELEDYRRSLAEWERLYGGPNQSQCSA